MILFIKPKNKIKCLNLKKEKKHKVIMLCMKNKLFDQVYFNGGGEHKVPCSFSFSMHRGAEEC